MSDNSIFHEYRYLDPNKHSWSLGEYISEHIEVLETMACDSNAVKLFIVVYYLDKNTGNIDDTDVEHKILKWSKDKQAMIRWAADYKIKEREPIEITEDDVEKHNPSFQ